MLLADSYHADLMRVRSSDIAREFDALHVEGQRLIAVKGALSGVASNLRVEMRRTFEHDLPSVEAAPNDPELRARLSDVTRNLRPALQNAIVFLGKSLGARFDEAVFDEHGARRASSERLRRDIWMFAQIARAFAQKARHADPAQDQWGKISSFAFVREFLSYFRAMGYPLLRVGDYPRFDAFMAAINALEEADLFDPRTLESAAIEAEAFHAFLSELFERISLRDDLAEVPFDKQSAARALRLYLSDRASG